MQNEAASESRCQLYTRPGVQKFTGTRGRNAISELAGYLQRLDSETSLRQLQYARELQLNDQGMTLDNEFRFTSHAFRQAAQIIGPGVSKFLPDLAGMAPINGDQAQRLVDGRMAVRVWNSLVDLRYVMFGRYRVIRNERERTIEGFVSSRHQYLENSSLYREAVETFSSRGIDVSVYAASLVGRKFSLWFRQRTPQFHLAFDDQRWPFYGGYYFTNGEATGTSVRGTAAVFTPRGVCLGSYRKFGRRVTHVGRDFLHRLGIMFASVVSSEIPWDKLEAGAQALLTKSLGFTVDMTTEQRKERAKKVSHSLGVLGVQKNLAVEVTDLALAAGRYHAMDALEWSQAHQLYAGRTSLDLLVPLLRIARGLDSARRERLEQAAFDILMGRLLL